MTGDIEKSDVEVLRLHQPALKDERDINYTHAVCPACHAMLRDFTSGECAHPTEHCVLCSTHSLCMGCGAIKTDMNWGQASHSWFDSLATARYYETHGKLPGAAIPISGEVEPRRDGIVYEWGNGVFKIGRNAKRGKGWHLLLCWHRVGLTPPYKLPGPGERAFHQEIELCWPPKKKDEA